MAFYKCARIYVTENSNTEINTASGAVANFETDVVLPLIDVKAEIKAVETGTGAKSPSNPYVISGFTGANLYQSGANIWDEVWELGIIGWTGDNASSTTKIRCKNYISVKPNTAYYFVSPKNIQLFYYDANKNFISYEGSTFRNASKTMGANVHYIRFYVYDDTYGTTYNNDISINYPSNDTAYHAYNPNSSVFPVSWQTEAGEVFGGYYDFTTGKLVATHKKYTFTENEDWVRYSTQNAWYLMNLDNFLYSANSVVLSECFNSQSAGSATSHTGENDIWCQNTSQYPRLYIYNSSVQSKADMRDLTKNTSIVYPLATPIEYDLSDTANISALLGVNNIWSDTGDTTVEYRNLTQGG